MLPINTLDKRIYTFAMLGIITVLFWSMISCFVFNDYSVAEENALIENSQFFILLIALLLSLKTSLQRFRKDKIISVFFAFFSLGFILREVDLEDFNLPFWLIAMGSGTGRTVLLVSLFSVISLYAISKFRFYFDLGGVFFKSKVGISLILSGVFLVLGSLFEDIDIRAKFVMEECLELIAYGLFFRAIAVLARKEVRPSRHI